jgi:hypothetical protein
MLTARNAPNARVWPQRGVDHCGIGARLPRYAPYAAWYPGDSDDSSSGDRPEGHLVVMEAIAFVP